MTCPLTVVSAAPGCRFNTASTPRVEACCFALAGAVKPNERDLVSAINDRWEPDCAMGVKKMTAVLKQVCALFCLIGRLDSRLADCYTLPFSDCPPPRCHRQENKLWTQFGCKEVREALLVVRAPPERSYSLMQTLGLTA